MSGSIDRLKLVKASRFNFIADPSKTVDGFLAHEIAEVVPEVTSGEKDAMKTEEYEVTPGVMGEREVPDYQGIDQAKLVPLLTGALQEAITKIETLESVNEDSVIQKFINKKGQSLHHIAFLVDNIYFY